MLASHLAIISLTLIQKKFNKGTTKYTLGPTKVQHNIAAANYMRNSSDFTKLKYLEQFPELQHIVHYERNGWPTIVGTKQQAFLHDTT